MNLMIFKEPQWNKTLADGFKHVLFSPRKLGKIPNLTNIFQMGWFNHQLEPQKKNDWGA